MEPEFALIFKNMSSLANLNSQTKSEFTFKIFHIKLLGKTIQEKSCFNNIVSIKPTFFAN